MTFIPSVLSKIDNANSTTTASNLFVGTITNTTGYNSISVNIYSDVNSLPNGFEINFYSDESGANLTYSYTDTYLSGSPFTKTYNIYDTYYKVSFTSTSNPNPPITLEIRTRLCTNGLSTQTNSINVFDNTLEYTRDAFGKLRVTEPLTLLDLKFPSIDISGNPNTNFLSNTLQVCSDLSGNYSASNNGGCLTISGTGHGHYISQSRKFCVYQSGKSLLIKMSGIIKPTDIGITGISGYIGRIGFYSNNPNYSAVNTDPYNGLFYECDSNGNISINLSNQGSITKIVQSSWNIDPLDGSGSSGINLDFSKAQLFVIDLEWLGVGRIRFGFYIYGKIVYCHEITNINQLIGPYMPSINQPVRYELIGSISATGIASITQICSTVISEGGYTPVGRPFTAPTGGIIYSLNPSSTSTEYALIAIRGGDSNYFHQNILPTVVNIVDSQANNISIYRLRLFQNGLGINVNPLSWNSTDPSNSVVQWTNNYNSPSTVTNITSFTASSSILVAQGMVVGRVSVGLGDLTGVFSKDVLQITSNVSQSNMSNTSDILLVTCQSNGTNSQIYYDVGWTEVW
jgi:hypothetical protein